MSAPLAGRRILDLSGHCSRWPLALAAAMATRVCADYGATVDRPTDTTDALTGAEPLLPDGRSAVDVFLNDGKHRVPAGQDAPTGVRYDAAVGDATALERHARSVPVHARVSTLAPGRDDPATELSILALSGLLTTLREPGGPPIRLAGHQLAYAAGLATSTGLLAALLLPDVGQVVDVSLLDVAVWLNWKMPAGMLAMGDTGERGANPRNHWVTMPAADGWIALVYQEKNWPAIRDMIGDARLAEPRFADMSSRGTRWAELAAVVGPWFRARSRAEITAQAQRRHVPIGPVLDPVELLDDAQHTARGLISPDGRPGLPLVWNGTRMGQGAGHAT